VNQFIREAVTLLSSVVQIKPIGDGSKIAITSPYNPNFAGRMHAVGGRWDISDQVWVADARALEPVRDICREIYGEDDQGGEHVTLRVTW
jgi:hypothetical protein